MYSNIMIFIHKNELNIITMASWWARWCLKSLASQLFTQPFIQARRYKKTSTLRVTGLCEGLAISFKRQCDNVLPDLSWGRLAKRRPSLVETYNVRWRDEAMYSTDLNPQRLEHLCWGHFPNVIQIRPKNCYCFPPYYNALIALNIYPERDNSDVVACANICSDMAAMELQGTKFPL